MLGHRLVHRVDEDDVRLAGREAGLDQLLEQRAGVDLAALRPVAWASASMNSAPSRTACHELVGDEHAVVEVQAPCG